MKIREVISSVDAIKPNGYSTEEKVSWLSYLDATLIEDVINTHERTDEKYAIENGPYSPDNLDQDLIVPYPYCVLYEAYLKMKIDECNGETNRYNNSAIMYNSYELDFRKYYNKHNKPLAVYMKV